MRHFSFRPSLSMRGRPPKGVRGSEIDVVLGEKGTLVDITDSGRGRSLDPIDERDGTRR